MATDLKAKSVSGIDWSRFSGSVPGGRTLFQRLLAVAAHVVAPEEINKSMRGLAARVECEGLAFDYTRLSGVAVQAKVAVDPAVELLAFFGLLMFTVAGSGRAAQTRGWSAGPLAGAFSWTAWESPLSVAGVDAVIDLGAQGPARFETVDYRGLGTRDCTKGLASRRAGGTSGAK